ncbi:MAG: hypothetical protein EBY55_07640 [Gammaproteobacteria bacterium]|nr:hypothetical protein [Gammaproteobacteria bacterium]
MVMTDPILQLILGRESNERSLGALVTFLITHRLLEPTLMTREGSACARVTMQDLKGSEFLTTVLVGDIRAEHLSDEGRRFVSAYVESGRFNEDLALIDSVDSEWELYDALSPKMMATFKPKAPAGLAQSAKRVAAKILQFPGSKRSE